MTMPSLLQLTVLLNIVILSTRAQQPPLAPSISTSAGEVLAPVQAQPQAQPNLDTLSDPQPAPEVLLNPQPAQPTKPPNVPPTRSTVAKEFFPPTNYSPAAPIITIDVSQPPSTQVSGQPAQKLQTTPPQPALPSTRSPQAAQTETARSITFSEPLSNSNSTNNSFSSYFTNSISTSATSSSSTTPLPIAIQTSSPPSSRPNPSTRIPSSRNQAESRRLTDASNQQSSPLLVAPPVQQNSRLASTNVSVQFLKPKSKFKCLQQADCLNGAMCFNGTCFCPPGYTGETCAINIDECRQVEEPCLNNGICIDEVNQFRCECVAGFKGERCQDIVDMCIGSPCLNGAKCINQRVDYTCECEAGWEGRHCEKNVDECAKEPCQNNGTCFDLVNDYSCDCGTSGFTGKNCDVDFDDCAAKPCAFGAKECVDLIKDFRCICYDGWEGKRCENDINECSNKPCENNGTCIDKSLSIRQLHNQTADFTIYHDIREPSYTMNMSQYAGYTCECKEEYYGDRCEERKKCYTASVTELCKNSQAECINVGSSYECLISSSFDGNGQNYATYRVNGDFKLREIHIKYRSLIGGIIMSFETTKPESPHADLQLNQSGLYLNLESIKQNENENMNFEHVFLDGNDREISLALETPLEIKGVSLARPSFINEYQLPFKGCLIQVRLNSQLLPFIDYGPELNHSFELVDSSKLEVGQCRTCFEKDCLNNGHCNGQEGYDHCLCPNTFTGPFCETDVNECEKNSYGSPLCSNGGTCENLHGGYRCICKEGFRGEKCQEIFDYCKAKQPCLTGTCKNVSPQQGNFQCDCPSSHVGKRCDRKRDCSNECHNHHAQCVNNKTCACLPGRREERIMCEYVSSCEQVEGELCLNGGTCKNLEAGGYHCACPEPFYGPICELIEKSKWDAIILFAGACITFIIIAIGVAGLFIFNSVRKARATRGTYSPSTQEKFGNSASDLLKPPIPERLI